MKITKIITTASALFIGLLFLYAGFAKSANPSAFLFVLEEYQLNWPLSYIHLVAAILPILEIVLGLLILGNLVVGNKYYRFVTLGGGAVLLIVFLAVMVWALAHKDIFGCGCFGGSLGSQLSVWDLFKDALLILVALAGFCTDITGLHRVKA